MKSIVLILLICANLCFGQAPERRQSIKITDEHVRGIDSIINATYKADEPGAAVLLAQNGKILLCKGYGMANMELQVPVNPRHVFGIGTLSLYFTAAAILMLQEQGRLHVSDDIRKYIPGYNTHGKTITIEHLLTHTSGIPGFREYESYSVKAKLEESRYAGLQFSEEQPLLFDPGANWSYSLPGYGLLALIVEKISGQNFNEFVQQQIFDKLGMTQTHFGKKGPTPMKTTGYVFNAARGTYERYEEGTYVQCSIGIGSILSTVDDLYRWHVSLQAGKLISPATLKKAWTSYILPSGLDVHYGYGRTINWVNSQLFVEHGGVMPNYLSDEWQMPEENIYFVILSNQRKNSRTPPLIANKVAALIIGFNPTMPTRRPNSIEMTKLVGVYETDAVGTRLQKNYTSWGTVHWKIVTEDGKLFVKREGVNRSELVSFDDSTWHRAADPYSRFIFRKDVSGNTTGLTTTSGIFTQCGPPRVAKKIASVVPPPPSIVLIDSTRLKAYTGIFQQPDGNRYKLMIEQSKLVLTDEDNLDKKDLAYIGNNIFLDPKSEIKYKFIADKSERIVKLNYFDGTVDVVATRIRDNY